MTDGPRWPHGGARLNEEAARPMRRIGARLMESAILALSYVFWYIVIAYAVWWLIALARGQTPGKQIFGLVAVKSDGTPFGWGRMFVREVFKEIYWAFTLGLGIVIDLILLVLSDQHRTVADRVTGSTIVHVSTLQS
ncbi:RDD family protein [Candidatus Poriferisodalis sp.]|uniref:RDD family protein n=1 Tax=Candidatus Poriferisodalis sp. TaxID=3101277 RepID=UPI003D0AF8AE